MPELWTGCLQSVVFVSFINYTLSEANCLVLHAIPESTQEVILVFDVPGRAIVTISIVYTRKLSRNPWWSQFHHGCGSVYKMKADLPYFLSEGLSPFAKRISCTRPLKQKGFSNLPIRVSSCRWLSDCWCTCA